MIPNTPRELLIAAIQTARPGAQWSLTGNDYSGLVWLDLEQSKPTEKELGL